MTATSKLPFTNTPTMQRFAKQSKRPNTSPNDVKLEKHHIIPNFLLRKFAIKTKRSESKSKKKVWLYQKGGEPSRKLTKEVFAEPNRYLYFVNKKLLEKEFSDEESDFALAVQQVLDEPTTLNDQLCILIKFIHNLCFRGDFFTLVQDVLMSSNKEIEKTIAKIFEQFSSELSPEKRSAINRKKEDMSLQATERVLNGAYTSTGRRIALSGLLSRFEWILKEKESFDDTFILGDISVVGYSLASNSWRQLSSILESDLRFVVLPLSPKFALIGYPRYSSETLTVNEINKGVASASLTAFISSENSKAHRLLQNLIGSTGTPAREVVENQLSKGTNLYLCKNTPGVVTVKLTSQESCSLGEKNRALFAKLAEIFEQNSKLLLLAEPFHVECIFTDDINSTLKKLEQSQRNVVAQSPLSNPEACWIYEVLTQSESRFKKLIILNMSHFDKSEIQTGLLFEYFRKLHQLAAHTYGSKAGDFVDQTAEMMQRFSGLISRCHVLFKKVLEEQSSNSDEVKNNLVTNLQNLVFSCLDRLIDSQIQHLKSGEERYKDLAADMDILSTICISLAEFFVLATPEQRGEFFDILNQIKVFKVVFENEWENISKLSDEEPPKAKLVSDCFNRILIRYSVWVNIVTMKTIH